MTNLKNPNFDIQPKSIVKSLKALLQENQIAIEKLLSQKDINWDTLIYPLETLNDSLSRFWSPISHLNAVMNNKELRKAYNECLPLLSDYYTSLGQNAELHKAYKSIRNQTDFNNLNTGQQKVIDNALRDFRLSGIDLDEQKKKRFKIISARLSELSTKFEENVLDTTKAWSKHITNKDELLGLPEQRINAAKEAAEAKNLSGYLLTLDAPCYQDVVTHADSKALREEIYIAFTTRASDQGPNAGDYDNTAIINETLALRKEQAELLGFDNYAALSLEPKMADSSENVLSFLKTIVAKVKTKALDDLNTLKQSNNTLNPWDIAYFSEKLRKQNYDISEEEVRPYFPVKTVLTGLFEILNKVFHITFKAADADTWHDDVKFFELFNENDELIGAIYMDLFARENKRGGAWMDEAVCRRKAGDGNTQLPIAYLTCNFPPATKQMPALLSHNDVVTLFHEMGHCLQHLLTTIDYADVSGINGVPWDAVEFPSQFLEAWCWQAESLQIISGHYQTDEALPDELIKKLIAAKNFQAALILIRQLEFSIFDMILHSQNKEENHDYQKILENVRKEVAVIQPPAYNRFANAFSHIFAGGYDAGYYSYLWAEVMARDAFSQFTGSNLFNKEIGAEFKSTVLALGGSEAPETIFEKFMKREVDTNALLDYYALS